MGKLIWSERAILDVENIYDYIAKDSPMYAQLTVKRILESIERLEHFVESGRHLPEFPDLPYREVISGSYRIIYRYDADSNEINIVTVVHGRRLLTEEVLSE